MKPFQPKLLEELRPPMLRPPLVLSSQETIRRLRTGTTLEDLFSDQIFRAGLPAPEREYRFHPSRRWRFDFAWLSWKLAVEIDGGTFARGRASGHTSIAGMARDREKDAEAAILGWTTLRIDSKHVADGTGADWVRRWIKARTL